MIFYRRENTFQWYVEKGHHHYFSDICTYDSFLNWNLVVKRVYTYSFSVNKRPLDNSLSFNSFTWLRQMTGQAQSRISKSAGVILAAKQNKPNSTFVNTSCLKLFTKWKKKKVVKTPSYTISSFLARIASSNAPIKSRDSNNNISNRFLKAIWAGRDYKCTQQDPS